MVTHHYGLNPFMWASGPPHQKLSNYSIYSIMLSWMINCKVYPTKIIQTEFPEFYTTVKRIILRQSINHIRTMSPQIISWYVSMENDDNNEPNIKHSANNLCFSMIMRKTWYCDKIYGHSTPQKTWITWPTTKIISWASQRIDSCRNCSTLMCL